MLYIGKELLFSITKKDFRVEFYRGSGKGGQKRNKTDSACRITHYESGAVGMSEDERSQYQNKKKAFERLVKSEKFKKWHQIEVAKKMGLVSSVDEIVDRMMDDKNIMIEVVDDNGKWAKQD